MLKNLDDITPDMYADLNAEIEKTFEEGCHGQCFSCKSGCSDPKFPRFAKRLYAVAGGKGGTGKSTITALLAVALVKRGLKVGILDADIPGATQPQLFGAKNQVHSAQKDGKDVLRPVALPCGVKLLSFNLIAENLMEPVIWPGQDISNVVSYLYTGSDWSGLDVILVDMPSGAGDVPLNLYTSLPVEGVIIVAEPGELGVIPTQRYIALCAMLMSPPIAFVENKALTEDCVSDQFYTLPRCVKAAVPLSPDISAYSSDGKLDQLEVPSLFPIVDLIVKSVETKTGNVSV